MIFFCREKRKIQEKYLNQLSKYYNPDEFFNVFIASNFYFCYYYYYYCYCCLFYHSLCRCSFCASAERKPCTWSIMISHS